MDARGSETVIRTTLLRYTFKFNEVNHFLARNRGRRLISLAGNGSVFRRQPPHQFLLTSEQFAQGWPGGVGFDALLHFGEFLLDQAAPQHLEAALRFFPGAFLGGLEQDLEENPAVALLE